LDRLNWQPPHNELGTCVPVNEIVGQSDIAVIGLLGCVVYSVGMQFRFVVEWTDADLVMDPHGPWTPRGQIHNASFKLGVRYGDGTVFTNVDGHTPFPLGLPTGLRQDLTWWIPALPPEGDLELFCEWTEARIEKSRRVVDSAALRRTSEAPPIGWARPV
jgi:hypothetical protein